MNIKTLLKELEKVWLCSDMRYRGQNPACDEIWEAIQEKMELMTGEEISALLSSMTTIQLEEILPVLEDMVDEYPLMEEYIDEVKSN